ncbi:cytochrome P450 [Trametes polyzona]|nr:cytochrome P450 [Trametes polyzona]
MLSGLQSSLDVAVIFAVCFLALLYIRSAIVWKARTRGRLLPPGPKRLPFIGNLLDLPRWKPWLGFRDLFVRHGKIVYLEALGQSILVLGNPADILELLEKRSANTSDRTVSPLITLAGQGFNFAFLPYGQYWRRHRRVFWQHFHGTAARNYWPVQRAAARDFCLKLLDRPTELRDLIRYNFSAPVMKIVYGADIKNVEDERIEIIDSAFAGLRELTVSAQALLEFLPIFGRLPDWVPGTAFLRVLKQSQVPSDHVLHVEFQNTKSALEQGKEDNSMVAQLLTRLAQSALDERTVEEEERIVKHVAAAAVEGTMTFSTTESVFLALSQNPEVQKRAWEEPDRVVGPHRLPDFTDRESLVYINAIVKESLRWHNVLPLGVAHRTVEDDEFRGYFIPAGTAVVGNVWYASVSCTVFCMHDSAVYPDPHQFYPDRFIKDGQLDPDVLDPASLVFGWGRRICPGRHFGDAGLFITIATALHVFAIGPPLDADGNPIKVELKTTHGFLSYPEDSRCTVKPRSAEAASLLRTSGVME